MAVNTTGAEFKRFYTDPHFWPDDEGATWHDDEEVLLDGVPQGDCDLAAVPDTARVTISGGVVRGPKWAGNEPSLEGYFEAWRKAQATTLFVVECDRAALDTVLAAVVNAGGKAIR